MTNAELLARYDVLVAKAIKIANDWPWASDKPGKYLSYPVRLSSDGKGTATLEWTEDSSYDSGSYTESRSFPIEMLDWTDEQFAAWAADEAERLKRKSDEDSAEYARKREAEERALYLRLKGKYER